MNLQIYLDTRCGMVVQPPDRYGDQVALSQVYLEEILMNSVTVQIGARVCLWARRATPALGAGLLALLFSAPLCSQANLAHIVGTITDQSGAPIAGATVTVTNVEQNVSRSVTTDQGG